MHLLFIKLSLSLLDYLTILSFLQYLSKYPCAIKIITNHFYRFLHLFFQNFLFLFVFIFQSLLIRKECVLIVQLGQRNHQISIKLILLCHDEDYGYLLKAYIEKLLLLLVNRSRFDFNPILSHLKYLELWWNLLVSLKYLLGKRNYQNELSYLVNCPHLLIYHLLFIRILLSFYK